MVTGRGAVITGFKLLNKHKYFLILPVMWELLKVLSFYFGFGFHIPWPAQWGFYLNFSLPRLWPSLDQILPRPLLGPDYSVVIMELANNKAGWVLVFFAGYILIDAIVRSMFLLLIKAKIGGLKVEVGKFIREVREVLGKFILLRVITVLGAIILALFERDTNWPPGVTLMLILLGNLALAFVDLAIVYQKVNVTRALAVNMYILQAFPRPVFELFIWGMIINGLVSVPINWAIGSLVGLIGSVLIYNYVAISLALAMLYIYTGYANLVSEDMLSEVKS